ncbi:MAG: AraC family transcriptional regulator [Bacteroidaceae bacterium]|nr:AraC family transcriptional regulator [Bacteroidaceae bacterium]
MKQSNLLRVDFSNFPEGENFARIPDKMFLADNLDENFSELWQKEHSVSKTVQLNMGFFFICLVGEMKFEVDHKFVTAVPGQVVLVLPGSFFRYISQSANTKAVFMAVAPRFVDYSKDVRLGIEFGEMVRGQCVFAVPPDDIEEFLLLYKMLKCKLSDDSYAFKEDVARNVLSIIECNVFNDFLRYKQTEHGQHLQTRKDELFKLYLEEVKKHFVEERSVAFYAQQLCVTPKYLSTVIREVTGRHAIDFITTFVINECKALLHTDNISVKEVCSRMNFSNQSFFAKYFKQHTGMTPKEYKRKI